jgi:hypothetical protein
MRLGRRYAVSAEVPVLLALVYLAATHILRLQRGITDGWHVAAFYDALMARALVGGVAAASMTGH